MRKALVGMLFVATLLVAVNAAFAQNPNYEAGTVWRMVYYRIKPGQEDAFWKDFREASKVVVEQAKKEGVMTDYKIFLNPLKDRPDDWDVMLSIGYPNYAALDMLEAKVGAIYNKHYGSPEATAAAVKKRADSREVITIRLVREVSLK